MNNMEFWSKVESFLFPFETPKGKLIYSLVSIAIFLLLVTNDLFVWSAPAIIGVSLILIFHLIFLTRYTYLIYKEKNLKPS